MILGDPDIRPAARRIARALFYTADHRRGARKLPGAIPARRGSGRECLAMAGALGWLFALGGLISTMSVVPRLGLDRTLGVAALCAGPLLALWMARRVAGARRRANIRRAQGGTP